MIPRLTDTPMPVTQVAHAAGFASLRRFNAAFAERYRLSPTRLRAESPADDAAGAGAGFEGAAPKAAHALIARTRRSRLTTE